MRFLTELSLTVPQNPPVNHQDGQQRQQIVLPNVRAEQANVIRHQIEIENEAVRPRADVPEDADPRDDDRGRVGINRGENKKLSRFMK